MKLSTFAYIILRLTDVPLLAYITGVKTAKNTPAVALNAGFSQDFFYCRRKANGFALCFKRLFYLSR